MAVRFLNEEVSELCLGKPELSWIKTSAAVSDALTALKRSRDTHVSVWACGAGDNSTDGSCTCVGKLSMADVILFLCSEENLADPFKALEAPVSQILTKDGGASIVTHLEPNSSLLEAIDHIIEGTQNLVIPMQNSMMPNSRKKFLTKTPPLHNGRSYCWLTQEDVIRFLLNSIGAFSPVPSLTVESLNVIDREIMTVHHGAPASTVRSYLRRALTEQKSIAVVDHTSKLIGEISPFTLACCDPTAAAAVTALSAFDLMAYIDCGGPPEDLVHLVKLRLEERNLDGMLHLMDEFFPPPSSCSSSDDDYGSGRARGSGHYYLGRSSEAVVCGRKSSLVAVMIKALAHRVSCVWVVEEDYTVVGMVTFAGILNVLRSVSGGRRM